jgi:hypothetical protein
MGRWILCFSNLKSIYTEEYHEKYNWIWGTSYWLKTIDQRGYNYDINTMGDICLTYVCNSVPSRGLRPLVTIASTNDVVELLSIASTYTSSIYDVSLFVPIIPA